jgi:drug/metabolite transporter (DMT)-like permease
MSAATKAQLQIHACVLLWGFTAILGRLISLPALPLVFWRMAIVTAVLACVPSVWRACAEMPRRLLLAYAGVGLLLGLHWLTFYLSVKLANASVAATCQALTPVFLAFIEPAFTHARFDRKDVYLGVAAVAGVGAVLGGVPAGMRGGMAIGVLSAAIVAIFGALNKRYIHHAEALPMTAIEVAAGTALMAVIAAALPQDGPAFPVPGARDAVLLAVLALGCTLLPYWLHLVALRHLSAFWVALATNLEPVYAILLAIPLLGEHHELQPRFYLGVLVLMGAVLAYPLLRRGMAPARG